MSLSTPPLVLLRAAGRPTQPWVNGQGVTTPVTCGPAAGPGQDPLWWVNIARIPGDCDFSEMVGIDRRFMLMDDVDLGLDLDGNRTVEHLEVVQFAGEMAPRCSASGPARALNVMLRRGRAVGGMEVVAIDGVLELPAPDTGTVVVVVVDGEPSWPGGGSLTVGDAVRQDAGSRSEPIVLDGRGRVAVISVR